MSVSQWNEWNYKLTRLVYENNTNFPASFELKLRDWCYLHLIFHAFCASILAFRVCGYCSCCSLEEEMKLSKNNTKKNNPSVHTNLKMVKKL